MARCYPALTSADQITARRIEPKTPSRGSTPLLFLAALLLLSAPAFATGWTPLAHYAPSYVNLMLLLPDGTVMCQKGGGANWYLLTPDSSGHYINGTWTTLSSMEYSRQYFSSDVLPNGMVYVAGGEYGNGGSTAEIYDPKADSLNPWHEANPPADPWTNLNFPTSLGDSSYSTQIIRDAESEVLPNGNVLDCADYAAAYDGTILYTGSTNSWSAGPASLVWLSEASLVKLPDGSLLTADMSSNTSERYIPSSNSWIADGAIPVCVYDGSVSGDVPETGPAVLLPNGNALFLSGTGNGSAGYSALYTPSGSTSPGTWAVGAQVPGAYVARDAACAMMANGKVLCALSPPPYYTGTTQNSYPSPTAFFEYDYTVGATGTFTPVNAPAGVTGSNGFIQQQVPSYYGFMLDLPDGTVLYSSYSSQLYVYTPAANTNAQVTALRPTISSISRNTDGSYLLTGTLLNGISEGAAYGDDAQMASNYPIVTLTDGSGNAHFARTHDWSSTGVMQTNQTVTTKFDLPPALSSGTYSLVVSANGIQSAPWIFSVSIIWVDFNNTNSGDGSFENPYNTIAAGVSAASSGETIEIKTSGTSSETLTISTPVTIKALNGAATIGTPTNPSLRATPVVSSKVPSPVAPAVPTSPPNPPMHPGTPIRR